MNRAEMKKRLELVMLDETLSSADRDRALIPIVEWVLHIHEGDLEPAMAMYNNVMAEIVEENNLRKH